MGHHMLICQLGDVLLLLFPLLLLLAYVWTQRAYVTAVFYDYYSQLLPMDAKLNIVFQLTSAAVPLCLWLWLLGPRVFTDLAGWPGIVPVAIAAAAPNALLGYWL